MAEDAVIQRTLTMGSETIGSNTVHGIIKSAGVQDFNTGEGFFLTNANGGTLRIGNPSGNKLV